jgi:integrase
MNEEKRERGEGRIFHRKGSKNLWLQYYLRGEQIRVSAGTRDPRKAQKLLRKKIGQVEAGVHPDTRRITYEELRETYYADYVTNRRKSLRLGPDGNPRMDKVVRLDAFFAGYKASEIDASLIRKFTAEQQAEGLENGSINRSISALRRMFHLAKEDGKIRDLPHFPMVDEAAPRKGFFERDEYEALFAALPDYLRLPFAIGYFSGMREGEILGLKWDQVKFLDGTIELLAGETKNDGSRSVPIIPLLRVLLVEQFGKRLPDCPYVCFRLNRAGNAVKIGNFRKVWQSRCVKLGLGKMEPATDPKTGGPLFEKPRGPRSKPKVKMIYQGKIFHDLRRTGVRNLVRAGIPEKVAMAISGHTTRSVFDRYNISSGRDFVEAGRKLEAFHNQAGEKVGDRTGTVDASATSFQRLPY